MQLRLYWIVLIRCNQNLDKFNGLRWNRNENACTSAGGRFWKTPHLEDKRDFIQVCRVSSWFGILILWYVSAPFFSFNLPFSNVAQNLFSGNFFGSGWQLSLFPIWWKDWFIPLFSWLVLHALDILCWCMMSKIQTPHCSVFLYTTECRV